MNILLVRNREEFWDWPASHPEASECWVGVKRGKPKICALLIGVSDAKRPVHAVGATVSPL